MGSIGAAGEGVHIPYRLDGKVALVTGSGRGKRSTRQETEQSNRLLCPMALRNRCGNGDRAGSLRGEGRCQLRQLALVR
jgi:hypothetical protein